MLAGWISIGIGVGASAIGCFVYQLGELSTWLFSDFELDTTDSVKSRGLKPVFIRFPRPYAWIVFRVFRISPRKVIRQMVVTQFLFWALSLLFAKFTRTLPREKETALMYDAGNLLGHLSIIIRAMGCLVLLLGILSTGIGVFTLVGPRLISWIVSTAHLVRENYAWVVWLALGMLIGAAVLLVWPVARRGRRRTSFSKPPTEVSEVAANGLAPQSPKQALGGKRPNFIHSIGHHTVAHPLGVLGVCLMAIGRYSLAIKCLETALVIHSRVGELHGQAANLGNLGIVFYSKGELGVALDKLQQANEMYRTVGDQTGEAACLVNTGSVYLARHDPVRAHDHYRRALRIYERTGAHGMVDELRDKMSTIGKPSKQDKP